MLMNGLRDRKQKAINDKEFESKIAEAKADHDKAVELYLSYMRGATTYEERKRRINRFRCGG